MKIGLREANQQFSRLVKTVRCGREVAEGRGKRGGIRLIYYWEPASRTIYMLYLYAKNEQSDVTAGTTEGPG